MINMLSLKNPHNRDLRITFEPVGHKYTVDGDPTVHYTSVTTWNHGFFREFNANSVIARMMRSQNWKHSKYYGMTVDEIKKAWDDTRDAAAAAGTAMHYDIECFYNGLQVPNNSTEFSYFLKFNEDNMSHLRPYRTEWTIFDESLRISGSIDMVFENLNAEGNPDGTLSIYDWKRCKEIKKKPFGSEDYSNNSLISHIPDTNYWHYCLQLNTYKAILERRYDKRVTDLKLVCLHPDNGSYQCIQVVNLQKEVTALFEERINSLTALFEERTISLT